jgi:hypothetical protein
MVAPNPKAAKHGPRTPKAGGQYRGVKLQATGGRSRFSLDQIRKAVDAAVGKHADALSGKP